MMQRNLGYTEIYKKYMPDVIYMHSSKAGALGRLADIGFKNIVLYNPHGWAFNMNNISVIKKGVCIDWEGVSL